MKSLCVIAVLCSLLPSRANCSETVFSASAESVSDIEKIPASTMIDAILSDADNDDNENFSGCLKELHIDTANRHTLFRAVRLPKINHNENLYFVRPALEPYCHAFYGAHVFRFWLLSEKKKTYKILHRGIGDVLQVLRKKHHGYYDVIIENWTALNSIVYRYHYSGKEYKPALCKEVIFTNKECYAVEKKIPCNR